MKTIGIKLADGTFYPVLEEGEAKKRMLDLTTAKDNQTKVQIDLYRSENGTMDDAEYVDTLEVTKLNPHPNGEPELHLSVGLDEENHLTAEVVDPETGKKSETEVSLVSRTAEERAEPADFAIAGAAETSLPEITEEHIADTDSSEATFSPDELPDINSTALEDMPFHFDHSEPPKTNLDMNDEFEGAKPDFSDLDNEIPVEDKTLESVDFSAKDFDDTTLDDDLIGTQSPDLQSDSEIQTDTTTIDDKSTLADDSASSADNFDTEEFSLPDIDSDSTFDSLEASLSGTSASSALPDFDDDFSSETKTESSPDAEPEGFDLPDFDSDFADTSSSSTPTGLNFDDFDDPAFNTTSTDDSSTISDDDLFGTSSSNTLSGSAMDFSDLYDKETIAGEHASLYDEDEESKKTRTPVIICIICAIICVIATILVLFIVPSKYNLIASRNTNGVSLLDKFFSKKETVIEKPIEETPEDTKFIDVEIEEPAPEAVEDKIIIAPEPEKVVPVPPPAPVEVTKPEVKKTGDVKYHIRWGDTLWDISESYYKTPWKYPKIATYNKIKNPDLIISGTDILIPAE